MSREQREQQLLDVAESVFGERGYQDTTMEDIAAAAGITKPVIYDHFGSKERLLASVVDRAREHLDEQRNAAQRLLDPATATPEDFYRAGVKAFLQFFEKRRDSFRVYQQESSVGAAAGSDIEALRLSQARGIALDLSRAPALSGVPLEFLDGVAEMIIAANERVTGWWLRNPHITLDTAVELVMAVTWHGLARARFDMAPPAGSTGGANDTPAG